MTPIFWPARSLKTAIDFLVREGAGHPIKYDGLVGDAVIRDSGTASAGYRGITIQALATTNPGDPITLVALTYVTYRATQSSLLTALAVLIATIPNALFSFVGGAVAGAGRRPPFASPSG